MKRFARGLVAFLAVQALLFVGAVAVLYRPDRESYLAATIDKHARLAQAPSPRVIFVGASNLPFSLNSELIARETGYHPVNMGLAPIGLEFVLAEVKPWVRHGDIVVLSFPYDLFLVSDAKPQIDAVLRILELHPALLWKMSWVDLAEIAQGYDWVFGWMGRVVRAMARTVAGRGPASEEPFSQDSFNRFGDVVAHWSRPLPHRRELRLSLGSEYASGKNEVLGRFVRFVEARGGRVVYLFPAIPEEVFRDPRNREVIDRVEVELVGNLGIRSLNRPAEVAMPAESFFDTAYHLIGPAVQAFSSLVGARLRTALSASHELTDRGTLASRPTGTAP
jgi:hypothetical protein